jgi:hypothetical protein
MFFDELDSIAKVVVVVGPQATAQVLVTEYSTRS